MAYSPEVKTCVKVCSGVAFNARPIIAHGVRFQINDVTFGVDHEVLAQSFDIAAIDFRA